MEYLYAYLPEELVQFVIVALFSLLIGLSQRKLKLETAGVTQFGTDRTFTFIGILGFLLYMLDPQDMHLFMGGGAALSVLLALNYLMRMQRHEEYGITRTLIALIVYCIAPVVCTQPMWFSLMLVVVLLLFTELKSTFTEIARRMQHDELITLAKFLTISGIILPILPREEWIPGTGLTPYLIWLATVVVSGISYLSYLLRRYVFPNAGILLSAVLGGMYSSTATISVMARKCRNAPPTLIPQYAAGMVAAVGTRYIRFLILIGIFSPAMFSRICPYLLSLAVLSGAITVLLVWRGRSASVSAPGGMEKLSEAEETENPLEFKVALIFAGLFVLFTLLTYWVVLHGGSWGMNLLSVVAGLGDITPFILNLLGGSLILDESLVVACTLQAIVSSLIVNWGYAYFFSGRRKDLAATIRLGFLPVVGLHLILLAVFYIL